MSSSAPNVMRIPAAETEALFEDCYHLKTAGSAVVPSMVIATFAAACRTESNAPTCTVAKPLLHLENPYLRISQFAGEQLSQADLAMLGAVLAAGHALGSLDMEFNVNDYLASMGITSSPGSRLAAYHSLLRLFSSGLTISTGDRRLPGAGRWKPVHYLTSLEADAADPETAPSCRYKLSIDPMVAELFAYSGATFLSLAILGRLRRTAIASWIYSDIRREPKDDGFSYNVRDLQNQCKLGHLTTEDFNARLKRELPALHWAFEDKFKFIYAAGAKNRPGTLTLQAIAPPPPDSDSTQPDNTAGSDARLNAKLAINAAARSRLKHALRTSASSFTAEGKKAISLEAKRKAAAEKKARQRARKKAGQS